MPYEAERADVPGREPARRRSPAEARLHAAEAFDQARRQARLKNGNALQWLPRWQHLREIQLGMTKKQVQDNLPHKASIDVQNIGGDLSLIFHDGPAPTRRTSSVRCFCASAPTTGWTRSACAIRKAPPRPTIITRRLLSVLKNAGGEPTPQPAPWAGLWSDLPPQEPKPAIFRWTDDVTVLTCQRDGGGAEVMLREWPADKTLDQLDDVLPPLRFCDEGAAGVTLGQSRADVLKKFPAHKALENEDGVALAAPADGPYETLAVWFDAGKVVRVVAQHQAKPANAADVTAKMQEAWTRDFDRLGALRRQEGAWGPVLQAYGWHDDRVRVRLTAQDTADGTRLFTEWRYWPVTAKRLTVHRRASGMSPDR